VLTIVFLTFAAALGTFLCCLLVTRRAHKWALIDSPNYRSSHKVPTPSGGGIGFVLSGTLTGLYLSVTSLPSLHTITVLIISCVLAGVGLHDDRKPMPARLRLGIQIVMGASLLFVLGGLPEMQRFVDAWFTRTLIYAFLLLVIVWWINLYNFMDGIDGLAGMQTVFMLLAGAFLLVLPRHELMSDPIIGWMLCIAGATSGFLVLNWAPAKIFMGDVGSIYLAFMLLSFGLLSIRNEFIPVATGLSMWAILGATFATDATITLMTRMLTIRRWHEAHRTHLYQRLARKLGNHSRVTLLYLAVNLLWLLPLAFVCVRYPQWAVAWAVLAYIPLIALAIGLGAGRSDE
jgi:Fuc2NAc and GlcNAc transferase